MEKLKLFEIPSCEVEKVVNQNGEELSEEERQAFENFVTEYVASDKKISVYRGTNNLTVYNVGLDNIPELSARLFMLGCKAKHFEKEMKENKKLFAMNTTSKGVFEIIFERFWSACQSEVWTKSEGEIDSYRKFCYENEQMCSYFGNRNNLQDFCNKILPLNDEEKLKVKDYYVALLHAFESFKFQHCYMLSTTTNFDVATKFAQGGIIIFSWVPASKESDYIISFDLNYKNQNRERSHWIDSLGLPIYHKSPYSKEEEICVKAGVLPHYIIGYLNISQKSFVVNPHLLEHLRTGRKISYIVSRGITINQEHFRKVLSQTRYRACFHSGLGCCIPDYREN